MGRAAAGRAQERQGPSSRNAVDEAGELDAILPWGMGSLVESLANTLDDIIGQAMEDWNGSPSPSQSQSVTKQMSGAGQLATPELGDCSVRRENMTSSGTQWNMSWNDAFYEKDTLGDSAVCGEANPSRPDDGGDGDDRGTEALRKEMRRYRKQNGYLKKKVAALREELDRGRQEDVRGGSAGADELITLRMQIEHLLAQKSKLAYENDSLQRENKRLEELVEYFLGSAQRHNDEAEEVDGSTSFPDDSSASDG
jgi:hypothetical protein